MNKNSQAQQMYKLRVEGKVSSFCVSSRHHICKGIVFSNGKHCQCLVCNHKEEDDDKAVEKTKVHTL